MLDIYTDGSCVGTEPNRCAGYGVVFPKTTQQHQHLSDVSAPLLVDPQTNQRAEMMAILVALQRLDSAGVPRDLPVCIHSDSVYSINCVTKWRNAWIANGWLTAKKEPVKNRDILEPLCRLYDQRLPHVTLLWCKGHDATNEGNTMADLLATRAAGECCAHSLIFGVLTSTAAAKLAASSSSSSLTGSCGR